MAILITADIERRGVRFLKGCAPVSVEAVAVSGSDAGRKRVTWRGGDGSSHHEDFDTVPATCSLQPVACRLQPAGCSPEPVARSPSLQTQACSLKPVACSL